MILISQSLKSNFLSTRMVLTQLIKFGYVGAIATAFQYIVLLLLTELVGLDPIISSATGYTVSAVLNYALNYKFTFASSNRHFVAVQMFAVISGAGLLLNILVMYLATHILNWHYIAAQIVATILVFLWNFFANRHWTF